jgi:hypothetical protein
VELALPAISKNAAQAFKVIEVGVGLALKPPSETADLLMQAVKRIGILRCARAARRIRRLRQLIEPCMERV